MSAAVPDVAPPPGLRAGLRLVALVGVAGVWALPWFGEERGFARTGAPAAFALVLAWGLAVAARFAPSREAHLRAGGAVAAGLALLAASLVVAGHPWMPAAHRGGWALLFGACGALAALDAVVGRDPLLPLVRALAATAGVVGAALAGAPLAAGVAAAIGLLALLGRAGTTTRASRRVLEGALLVASLTLFLAPELQRALAPPPESPEVATFAAFLFRVLALAAAAASLTGLFEPEGRAAHAADPGAP